MDLINLSEIEKVIVSSPSVQVIPLKVLKLNNMNTGFDETALFP